jgi:hypothetical protein
MLLQHHLNDYVQKFIRILKNGAMVSGPYSGQFRQQCLHKALILFTKDLLPLFIAHGLSKMNKQMELLVDTNPIEDMWIIGRQSPMCMHLPDNRYKEGISKKTTNTTIDETQYENIFDIIEMMKNGAMVSDYDKYIDEYRQFCLEQVFFRFTNDILPELLSRKIIFCNDRYRTILINLKYISDKKDIRPVVCDSCTEKFKAY